MPPASSLQPQAVSPGSFVKAASFRRALRELAGHLGITGLDLTELAGGGHHIGKDPAAGEGWHPFKISRGGSGNAGSISAGSGTFTNTGGVTSQLYVQRGFVIWMGRCFILGEQSFSYGGSSDWIIYIEIEGKPTASAGAAPSDPWSITTSERPSPRLKFSSTTYVRYDDPPVISDTDPTGDENISTADGTIRIPIAFQINGAFVQNLTFNPTVILLPNGNWRMTGGWIGPDA